jgi:UDP-N-acetylglucosamine--N-acetylmuramyl-(pentapeptide) pyrophosphoryl-undecaprenol N-acetylglucosamine transferase
MPKREPILNESCYVPKILFAAGGTGGHIYPALAVQKALASLNGRMEYRFICGSRPLETDLYNRSGVKPVILDIPSRKPGVYARFADLFRLVRGFFQAFGFLRKWKPDWIMAQGGYVTAPVLMAARILGIPYDIQEQNTIPGRTNKWFASGAHTIYCSFKDAVSHFTNINPGFRCVYSGMPLRPEAIISNEKNKALIRQGMGLDPTLPLLLILGGSQGASNLYRHLLSALHEIDGIPCPPFQCLWSTGPQNLDWIKGELASKPMNRIRAHVLPYLDDMGKVYSVTDVAVSRAGACSVAELTANRIPTIFVPLPHSKDDHQRYNALAPVKAGAAFLVEENQFVRDTLVWKITDMMSSSERRVKMTEAAGDLMSHDAAETIARDLYKKIKNSC